uniref:Symplekin n=1 Tax=Davidia involucrata TaxID=16924 RepID=A0A5B6YLP6_DAVIN
MAGPLREQALSLLAAANNHGDLAVKLSSLKQAKDILLSVEPSLAAELFPYLVELQSSPESLVRRTLIEVMEEIGLKAMDHSSILMPILLASLKDSDPIVAGQSIVSGTNIFCNVLEELSLQFHRHGIVESWLEELWTWMVRFKDAVFGILLEAGSVGTKFLAVKFLETCVILFTSNINDSEKSTSEAITRSGRAFNISWLVGGHLILDPVALTSEANRCIGILLDLLQSASSLPGSLIISVVNCLAAIARKRPLHYSSVLSALLDFDPKIESVKGGHTASIQYSLRTAFLGFLKCTSPAIVESRDRLLRALRAMSAGDAADQFNRQVEKMIKNNERALRDARLNKDDQPSSQLPISEDLLRKRSMPLDNEEPTYSHDVASKRIRYGPSSNSAPPVQISDSEQDYSANGVSPKVPLLDSDLTPVEQMIAMIGALIAEGERGAGSLEILISQIHSDLLADIVITNMKHLPKDPPPLIRLGSLPSTQQGSSPSAPSQVVAPISPTISVQSPVLRVQVPFSSSNAINTSLPDVSTSINLPADSKRDPRRDPRRLDPRRVAVPVGVPSTHIVEDSNAMHSGAMQSDFDASVSLNKPLALPVVTSVENTSVPLMPKIETDLKILENPVVSGTDLPAPKEEVLDEEAKETVPVPEVTAALDHALSPVYEVDEDSMALKSSDVAVTDEAYESSLIEADQLSPAVSSTTVSEEVCPDLPVLPLYVELTEEQQRNLRKLAVERIIESYKHLWGADCSQTRMALLARLVAQIDADDDMVVMMQKHIVSDYQHQKGHELAMHVLYHLHTLMISDSVEHSSFATVVYEKFLLGVAKSLLDNLPATDKSFSRLLGEVPFLPDSALELLDDICYSDNHCGKDVRDGDRVTQGLGTVWSLILGRPLNRQACLDIALKCAVHLQDDIRAKAIRLVANKLYVLNYISESIEQFATNMFLSAVDHRVSDIELSQSGSIEQITEGERGSQETSISGSQISEPGTSENDSVKGPQSDSQIDSSVSFAQAQCLISLFFALCTKKPSLLQLVFDNYARSPKAVKQAVHRHIPILIRALGSSYSELLCIISDPPEGSENLLTQVLHILSEGKTPSSDLISTVKHLYETKLKDVTILIPMLSSLSKNEVLPIFPRLVDLPLDKFQRALAHILQGSAHTGPALTPAEVLVVIHDINPEKDGLALKKITDVCSACFEQRTVFTQQVLAKALNQMVDQTPLPLLFMRTVIQAIDAFPTLVDFVMELLSKLVSKQVWRMPKLWVGFLKCVSQTQPHSFHVLLQLPSPQLESALNKYANLRGPLAAYASQPSVKVSLPRSTLVLLGLANESHVQQPHLASSLHASDTSSSVHGATLT